VRGCELGAARRAPARRSPGRLQPRRQRPPAHSPVVRRQAQARARHGAESLSALLRPNTCCPRRRSSRTRLPRPTGARGAASASAREDLGLPGPSRQLKVERATRRALSRPRISARQEATRRQSGRTARSHRAARARLSGTARAVADACSVLDEHARHGFLHP